MNEFDVLIGYSALTYLLLFLMFTREGSENDFWDKIALLTAPISVPLIICWTFVCVLFED